MGGGVWFVVRWGGGQGLTGGREGGVGLRDVFWGGEVRVEVGGYVGG